MIKPKIEDALNKQLNSELYSSYLYLAMSAYFASINLSGFSAWMRVQSQEENIHAMKFYDYILHTGSKIRLYKIDEPKAEWNSPQEAFEEAYKHEQSITEKINNLVDLAVTEKDYATNNLLQWFINEQVEEESTVLKILEQIKMVGNNKNGLFFLDREFVERTLTTNE